MKQILLIWFFVVASLSSAFAQNNEVSLIVTGEGATKQEATINALRSAIEQAFGVFVSANTEILNDELVKDEIATVSSGNVKSFKEISSVELPSGLRSVTLDAIVSIGKLIEYSKNHGSKAEFAGAVFGANIKMRELRKQNESRAIINQLQIMLDSFSDLFNARIEVVGSPLLSTISIFPYEGNVICDYCFIFNDYKYYVPTRFYQKKDVVQDKTYSLPLKVHYDVSEYGRSLFLSLKSLLAQLSISKIEREEYESQNIPYYSLAFPSREDRYYFRSEDSITGLSYLSSIMVYSLFKAWDLVLNFTDSNIKKWALWTSNWKNTYDYSNYYNSINIAILSKDVGSIPDVYSHEYLDENGFALLRSYYYYKYNLGGEYNPENEEWIQRDGDNTVYITLRAGYLKDRSFCINDEYPHRFIPGGMPGMALIGEDDPIILCRMGSDFPVDYGFSKSLDEHSNRGVRYLLSKSIESVFNATSSDIYNLEFYLPVSKEEIAKVSSVEIKLHEQ